MKACIEHHHGYLYLNMLSMSLSPKVWRYRNFSYVNGATFPLCLPMSVEIMWEKAQRRVHFIEYRLYLGRSSETDRLVAKRRRQEIEGREV